MPICRSSWSSPGGGVSPSTTIDWGDGSPPDPPYVGAAVGSQAGSFMTASTCPKHTYATPGVHTATVTGPVHSFGELLTILGLTTGQRASLTKMTRWDWNGCISMRGAFNGCVNLVDVPATIPEGLLVVANGMFAGATAFNADISGWDMSAAQNLGESNNASNPDGMFAGATAFNQDISGWDTGKVSKMLGLFRGASSFDQDLSGWDVHLIPTAPWQFADGTPSGFTTARRPQWGTNGSH